VAGLPHRGARRQNHEEDPLPRPARGSVEIVNRKDGQRSYGARITVDGRRHRVRLGTDRDGWSAARAQVELEEQIKTVQAGTWAPPERAARGDDGRPDRTVSRGGRHRPNVRAVQLE
jgi:hypothetical protein